MADYGICENQECELFYENASLDKLHKKPEPTKEDLKIFQNDSKACVICGKGLLRTTDPSKPRADGYILMIDELRTRGILEWPGQPETEIH